MWTMILYEEDYVRAFSKVFTVSSVLHLLEQSCTVRRHGDWWIIFPGGVLVCHLKIISSSDSGTYVIWYTWPKWFYDIDSFDKGIPNIHLMYMAIPVHSSLVPKTVNVNPACRIFHLQIPELECRYLVIAPQIGLPCTICQYVHCVRVPSGYLSLVEAASVSIFATEGLIAMIGAGVGLMLHTWTQMGVAIS